MTDLREAWADLLRRGPTPPEPLGGYGRLPEGWARSTPPRPLAPSPAPEAWRASWQRGTPLVALAADTLRAADLEELLGGGMEALARVVPALGPALQSLAEAWDRGALTPAALLPTRGRLGTAAAETTGLGPDAVAFLAGASLRPVLEALFASARESFAQAEWSLGICPFCGGPPGFADLVEDGRRVLACHLCGGTWPFARLRCPFCGAEGTGHQVRLTPEEAREEGYGVSACRECRAYLKEVDRRARWNAGPPLV